MTGVVEMRRKFLQAVDRHALFRVSLFLIVRSRRDHRPALVCWTLWLVPYTVKKSAALIGGSHTALRGN